jgi:LAS superfamily LD-carboxypeptidase LdcB
MYPSATPNYSLRRAFALSIVLLLGLGVYSGCQALAGGDGNGSLTAGTTSSSSSTTVPLEVPPPCAYGDEPTTYASTDDWARTIVDTRYSLPQEYRPPDLVAASEANYSPEFLVRPLLVEDLNALRNAILEEGIPEVALLAAYRPIEVQADLFARREAEMGFERAAAGTARPGHSEHHLGTTIDLRPIGAADVDQSFGDTETGRWLETNSWRFGFVLSYPRGAEDVTCYKYEPWHFRYVGRELASRVERSGLTLREYLWHWEVTGSEPGTSPAPAGGGVGEGG